MDHEPRFKGEVSEERHNTMSKIRGKDTKPEIILRKYLWNKGVRYKKNCKGLPGRPDIAITKYKVAVFCDSEFFHGKDWDKQRAKIQQGSHPDYWVKKIERNIARDKQKDKELQDLGWIVIHFWSKDIEKNTDDCFLKVKDAIEKRQRTILVEDEAKCL